MLGDIVKVLEYMTATLKGAKSPEHRRRRAAKTLLKLYVSLTDVIDRGREIVDAIRNQNGRITLALQ